MLIRNGLATHNGRCQGLRVQDRTRDGPDLNALALAQVATKFGHQGLHDVTKAAGGGTVTG